MTINTATEAADVPASETIDMGRAVAIADGKASADGLTDVQKQLVEVVKEERKTEMGRTLTDEAAHNGYALQAHHGMYSGDMTGGSSKTVTVKLEQDDHTIRPMDERQNTLHHELVHADQDIRGLGDPPDKLSSLDRALWNYGREGQAYVADEEDRRERKGLPPMTDEEKRARFAEGIMGKGYAGQNGVGKTNREDGLHLTEQEFEKAFGSTPGHPGNFLAGGHFTDPINTFDPPGGPVQDQVLHRVRVEEEGPFIPYDQLPQSGKSSLRVEGTDKKYVFFIDRKTDSTYDVTLYERDDAPGHAGQYVKLDTQPQQITTDPNGNATFSYIVDQAKDGKNTQVNLTVGTQDYPEVHATIDAPGNHREYVLQKVQNNKVVGNNDDLVNNSIFLPPSQEHFAQERGARKLEQDVRKVVKELAAAINSVRPAEHKGNDTMGRFQSENVGEHSAPVPTPVTPPGGLQRGL